MQDKITALAFDIIFKAIYGSSSSAQTKGNDDLDCLDAVASAAVTARETWNPFKKRDMAHNSAAAAKSLDYSITTKIGTRFDALKQDSIDISNKRGLGILDLILRERIREAQATSNPVQLDADFVGIAVANIKAMMLAGTGTTTVSQRRGTNTN